MLGVLSAWTVLGLKIITENDVESLCIQDFMKFEGKWTLRIIL